jgi:hypothetical protein
MASAPQAAKRPQAPPTYRPQPARGVCQTRAAQGKAVSREQPKSPQHTKFLKSARPARSVLQGYIPPDQFLEVVARFKRVNGQVDEQRLFHWNNLGKFDEAYEANDGSLVPRLEEWNSISESVGGGLLAPGQVNENEQLPTMLDYFADFQYALPHGWGVLRFAKRFDRMTEHGWISDNVPLPKGIFGKTDVAVHMIIAIRDAGDDTFICNPHVTIRVKDYLTMITMMNDQKAKTMEMKKLGMAATQNSLSIGLKSERIGKDIPGVDDQKFQAAFSEEWIAGVVKTAEDAAKIKASKKPKAFILK